MMNSNGMHLPILPVDRQTGKIPTRLKNSARVVGCVPHLENAHESSIACSDALVYWMDSLRGMESITSNFELTNVLL